MRRQNDGWTVGWFVVTAAVFGFSSVGLYWLLDRFLGMGRGGAMMLLLPTVVVTGASAIYFYGVGWSGARRTRESGRESPEAITFKRRFRICVFTVVGVVPLSLALSIGFSFGFKGDALVFGVIAAMVVPWAAMKIISELRQV